MKQTQDFRIFYLEFEGMLENIFPTLKKIYIKLILYVIHLL
jgi:hypothetical protein